MNEPDSVQKIQRFVPQQWPSEVSVHESSDYTYHHFAVPEPVPKDQLQLVENEPVIHHDNRAAAETAYLQAQINAKRNNVPNIEVEDTRDSVGHTAFLQHQIDLRRSNLK